ncbi:MAG: lipocalin-like domain-containing protein [Chloroflexota bacterium]
MRLIVAIIVLLIASGLVIARLDRLDQAAEIRAEVENISVEEETSEFARAYEIKPMVFPDDLGQHPDYQAEWWYYTGNLADAGGNRFGFQLTFFRRGLTPGLVERPSEWASNQIYFAHFTVTDVTGDSFTFHERFSRGRPGLAGAQSKPYHVWLDDWYAQEIGPGQVELRAEAGDIGLQLVLTQAKPAARQGDRGLSQKSDEPGNASYYYSLTNNPARGTITTPRGAFAVSGNAWKDHEWSTSGLGPEAVGWDWYSLQLEDGREIMYFNIRQEDGSVEAVSGGALIEPDGRTRALPQEAVEITILDTWQSPDSGAVYPAEWTFAIPSEGIDLHLEPLLPQQELRVSFTYWEGAVQIEGTQRGYGYIELTGYYASMQGRL